MIIDTFFTHWDFFQTRFETAVSVFCRLFSGIAIFNHSLLSNKGNIFKRLKMISFRMQLLKEATASGRN
jgi:hypothetical protein